MQGLRKSFDGDAGCNATSVPNIGALAPLAFRLWAHDRHYRLCTRMARAAQWYAVTLASPKGGR